MFVAANKGCEKQRRVLDVCVFKDLWSPIRRFTSWEVPSGNAPIQIKSTLTSYSARLLSSSWWRWRWWCWKWCWLRWCWTYSVGHLSVTQAHLVSTSYDICPPLSVTEAWAPTNCTFLLFSKVKKYPKTHISPFLSLICCNSVMTWLVKDWLCPKISGKILLYTSNHHLIVLFYMLLALMMKMVIDSRKMTLCGLNDGDA